jgi:hypothetical protein
MSLGYEVSVISPAENDELLPDSVVSASRVVPVPSNGLGAVVVAASNSSAALVRQPCPAGRSRGVTGRQLHPGGIGQSWSNQRPGCLRGLATGT